jgi:hypothetical protein
MGLIMGSQNIMGSDYGSNISAVGKALEFGSGDWSSTPSAEVNFTSSFSPVIILIKHVNIKNKPSGS